MRCSKCTIKIGVTQQRGHDYHFRAQNNGKQQKTDGDQIDKNGNQQKTDGKQIDNNGEKTLGKQQKTRGKQMENRLAIIENTQTTDTFLSHTDTVETLSRNTFGKVSPLTPCFTLLEIAGLSFSGKLSIGTKCCRINSLLKS